MFPVLQGKTIKRVPWAMLTPHEPQALINHDQSLERLAQRGGLGADEMIFILEDRGWTHERDVQERETEVDLIARVEAWRKTQAPTEGRKGTR